MAWSWLASLLPLLQTQYPQVILSIAFLFLLFHYRYRSASRFPVNWPIVGMLPALLANLYHLHGWFTGLLRDYGSTLLFRGPWFCGMDILVTADPANMNQIFNTNFPNYPKGADFSEIFDILGDGIFTSDAESWRSQRRRAHSLMVDPRFRSFVAECSRNKVAKGLIPLLNQIEEQEVVVDLQDVFLRLTFDLTCNFVFGVDPGCLSADFPTVPFAKAMDDAMGAVFFRFTVPSAWWKLQRLLKISEEKKLAMAWEVIDHFIAETISKRGEKKREALDASFDLLTSYIHDRSTDQGGGSIGYNDKFLRDTTLNLMLAGRDTTGVALTWFFWLLSKNPHAETRILDELKGRERTCSNGVVIFDTEELGKLVYLHAALCESLRLFPPLPFEHKGVLRPELLPSGDEARPSTKILISIYGMGRMEGVWGKDCLEFKPERWITEQGKVKHEPSYKFLSFNAGPRICLGKDMAFTQMKVVAAAIVYNYRVEAIEGHAVEPKFSVILHMKNGLMVRVRKRSSE